MVPGATLGPLQFLLVRNCQLPWRQGKAALACRKKGN